MVRVPYKLTNPLTDWDFPVDKMYEVQVIFGMSNISKVGSNMSGFAATYCDVVETKVLRSILS